MNAQESHTSVHAGFLLSLRVLKGRWRSVALVSAAAAAAGSYSEIIALSDAPGSFSGPHLHAAWTIASPANSTWTSASVWSQRDFVVPLVDQNKTFRTQRSTVVALNYSSADWTAGAPNLSSVWAFSPVPAQDLIVEPTLTRGALATTVPANLRTMDANGTWESRGVRVDIDLLVESAGSAEFVRQQQWSQDPLQGVNQNWQFEGRMAMDAKGLGQISLTDGTSSTVLVSESHPTTWAAIGNLRAGRLSEDWSARGSIVEPNTEPR